MTNHTGKRSEDLRRHLFLKCQRGATAVEYGLILAMIALAVIGALSGMAGKTVNMWGNVSNEVSKH